MISIAKIIDKLKPYMDKKELALIKKAYDFACIAHENQIRGTGESYITHPLETAYWLTRYEVDAQTIAAALLHDVEEDNPFYTKEIRNKFGDEIADLVHGVTKLGKIKIKKSWFLPIKIIQEYQEKQLGFERHIESLRRMLLAMSKDIRIILIKFADRIHNMETIEGVKPEKRTRIALETIEIYAPLAYRLGMGELKGILEDLAFPYAYPKEYQWLNKLVGPAYKEKEIYLEKFINILKKQLLDHKIKCKIHGRKKHFYSLYKKLLKHDRDLSKIYDLVAVRVIVNSIEDCYKTLGIIHSIWRPLIGRIKDFIALPKPNGYKSLHTTVFGTDGEIIEVQIRTQEMHDQAENGIASHWHYSEKKTSEEIQSDKFVWLDELQKWQQNLKNSSELSEALKLDFFSDRIYAFSPLGDIFDLPLGATPVDFAYSIHTDLGHNCVGAKVNNKLVKLNYQLKNGDIVEIINKKDSKPKRDWLKSVVTSRAKSKIRSFFDNKKP